MNIKIILILAGLLLAPALANAQTQKSLIGFQGIPWGSSMASVKAKFPQVKEIDYCKVFDKIAPNSGEKTIRQRFKEEDSNCVHLLFEDYIVAPDVNFNLAFYFTRAGALEQVFLSRYFKQEGNSGYLSDCIALFDRTNSLLNINYGLGVNPSNSSEIKRSYDSVVTKIWLPLPTEILLNRNWDIKLSKGNNMPDLCEVNVMYSKRGVAKL